MAGADRTNGGDGHDTRDPYDALEFPCRFEIKVMGRPSNRFRAVVEKVLTGHLQETGDLLQVLEKHSRNGRFVSMTYIIWARHKAQIRTIYGDLARVDLVLMVL